jgi:ubiquitin carboxyl-terminal hydrolase 10
MSFANAVLQLLVHSPPFWDLFRQLGSLKGQRGAEGSETGGGATPLVDAMVRFFDEFMFKGKEPPPTQITQQLLQHITRENPREGEEKKDENKVVDSFEPTYIYDAMKAKRQLKNLLVRFRDQNTPFCY